MNCHKGKTLLILCFFYILVGKAQNFVPNNSFESMDSCASFYGEIANATGWGGYGTPELFCACSNFSQINTPNNVMGYQSTNSGFNYAGIIGFEKGTVNSNFREFIFISLLDTLSFNKSYCFSIKISLCDSCLYAIDKIGAYFNDSLIDPNIGSPPYLISLSPQVEHTAHQYLNDKINWTEISGSFIAEGNEKHLTIGNFATDLNTDTVSVLGAITQQQNWRTAYYYIDDVSVEEIKPVNAGTDKSIFIGDSVLIGLNMDSAATYAWWPHAGITDTMVLNPWVQPTQTTTYYVSKTQCSVTTTDTVVVVVNPIGIKENYFTSNISVQPNPNNGNFTIEYTKLPKDCYLEIYELSGKFVYNQELLNTSSSIIIHLEELGSGLYIYKIKSTEGLLKTGKLVISK